MTGSAIRLSGSLMGRRRDPERSIFEADIVHVRQPNGQRGPAENSFVLVEHSQGMPKARYISWINYFDIEYAARREGGAWALIEPSEPYENDVAWWPYGWPGARSVPTIGDAILEEINTAAGNALPR